ncbi:MAG: glycosyltransferase family 2 protein [Gammaproteobacteria bacterium]|nr:glycosyltransferase family 2 protein [Gammaproteobacteria bacterium]
MSIAFSVAIPAYNSAPFIGETLDAILNQTYPPAEVVVVDDGSTDDTAAILNRYAHRVRSLRITNSGPGMARKTAIELCTSAWIALCDSDDVWNPDYLNRKVCLIDRFPDINLACANFASFGPGAAPRHTHQPPVGWRETFAEVEDRDFVLLNDPYRAFLNFNIAYLSGTAFTMGLYQKIGGINPQYSRKIAEDVDLTSRLALHPTARTGYDQHLCWNYRRHPTNFSTSAEYRNLLGSALILQDHLSTGLIPLQRIPQVSQEVANRKKTAFLSAYWVGCYAEALDIYRTLPATAKPFKLRLQAMCCKFYTITTLS